MLNKIIIQGRCGNNPELRTTTSGVPVATVDLAVDRDIKNQNGERETDWITIVAWRGLATFLANNFTKGKMAVVSGRLQIRNWTDKDGNKRKAAEIVADAVYFGDSKNTDGDTKAPYNANLAPYNGSQQDNADFTEVENDDLPF